MNVMTPKKPRNDPIIFLRENQFKISLPHIFNSKKQIRVRSFTLMDTDQLSIKNRHGNY
jgi:hypothetical protein